ncbi:ATP-binding protein [Streptomyces ipomoeae]|uniref:ATP-binding protein n=1 Tax=Streptomyces ipomoeae TaxID=103232 RepID=UPI00215C033E|nr:ATP-binding protein [Streptomyces ipomoeae]
MSAGRPFEESGGERGGQRLLWAGLDAEELPLLRVLVTECALRAGLSPPSHGVFVQAVVESAAHAVTHGGDTGTIELRVLAGELHCEITDGGPGLLTNRPEAHGLRLAQSLVRSLAGCLELHTTPRGTTTTLSVRLPAPTAPTIPAPSATTATAR